MSARKCYNKMSIFSLLVYRPNVPFPRRAPKDVLNRLDKVRSHPRPLDRLVRINCVQHRGQPDPRHPQDLFHDFIIPDLFKVVSIVQLDPIVPVLRPNVAAIERVELFTPGVGAGGRPAVHCRCGDGLGESRWGQGGHDPRIDQNGLDGRR